MYQISNFFFCKALLTKRYFKIKEIGMFIFQQNKVLGRTFNKILLTF